MLHVNDDDDVDDVDDDVCVQHEVQHGVSKGCMTLLR